MRQSPPAQTRAVHELRVVQDALLPVRDAQLELGRRIRQYDERAARDRAQMIAEYRRVAARAQDLQIQHDLRAQEVAQISVKVAALEHTYRRYLVQRDDLALRDAVDLARQLGIPRGALPDYL